MDGTVSQITFLGSRSNCIYSRKHIFRKIQRVSGFWSLNENYASNEKSETWFPPEGSLDYP